MNSMLKKTLTAAAAAVLVFTGVSRTASAESNNPADIIADYVARVQAEEYEDVYNESFSIARHVNGKEEYFNTLKVLYGNLDSLQYKVLSETADEKLFALYSNDEHIANLRHRKLADGSWATATSFLGEQDYIVEVPSGLKIRANGTALTDAYMLAEKTTATNVSGLNSVQADLAVDQYKLQGMISEPVIAVEGDNNYTTIKDVTCNSLYVGRDLTDNKELQDTLITYAKTCAMWPAGDTTVGAVAAISIQDSDWYRRVSEVQNFWFTAHSAPTFSNEKVLKIVQQGDDTIIANVVFDYYATDGVVSRTWNCGYQMTLVDVGGYWMIAGMGIDSTMNPNYKAKY
ncbi:MAG: hypothetical protein IJ120_05035 [Solobacterium sp.]|nr:hypothetical protein [Solobacterium sp.]